MKRTEQEMKDDVRFLLVQLSTMGHHQDNKAINALRKLYKVNVFDDKTRNKAVKHGDSLKRK